MTVLRNNKGEPLHPAYIELTKLLAREAVRAYLETGSPMPPGLRETEEPVKPPRQAGSPDGSPRRLRVSAIKDHTAGRDHQRKAQ